MAISPSPFDRMRRRQRPGSRLWMLWAALAFVLIVGVLMFRQGAANAFWTVMAPVVRLRESFSHSEVARLKAELASTSAALADRDQLYRENIDLKARLGRTDVVAPRILAGVLMKPPWTPYDTLLIDAGAREGVALDDRVSAGGTTLIGRVVELYDHTARVELFSAPGQGYQGLLRGTVPVAVEGQGGGSMQAEVPAGTPVAVGDSVVFPGLGGGIAAEVSALDERAQESFIVIYMHLPADPFSITTVEVWKEK